MLNFFKKTLCIVTSMFLLAACGKKPRSSYDDAAKVGQISTPQESFPVLNHADQALDSSSHQESSGLSLDPVKRFSYEAFTKKNVQLTPTLDFPLPISFSLLSGQIPLSKQIYAQGTCLVYEGNLSLKKLITFYNKQMHRSQWSLKNLSTDHEGLLVCTSQQHQVIVSIRNTHNQVSGKKRQLWLFFDKNAS